MEWAVSLSLCRSSVNSLKCSLAQYNVWKYAWNNIVTCRKKFRSIVAAKRLCSRGLYEATTGWIQRRWIRSLGSRFFICVHENYCCRNAACPPGHPALGPQVPPDMWPKSRMSTPWQSHESPTPSTLNAYSTWARIDHPLACAFLITLCKVQLFSKQLYCYTENSPDRIWAEVSNCSLSGRRIKLWDICNNICANSIFTVCRYWSI